MKYIWLPLFLLVQITREWCFFTSFAETNNEVISLDYSPDGQFIATGSASKRVSIFSTKTYDLLWFDTLPQRVLSVKFSPLNMKLGVTLDVVDNIYIYNIDGNGIGTPNATLNPSVQRPQGGWN